MDCLSGGFTGSILSPNTCARRTVGADPRVHPLSFDQPGRTPVLANMAITLLALIQFKVTLTRVVAVVIAIGLWLWTQALLAKRTTPTIAEGGAIFDGIHQLTARINARLLKDPKR